MKSIFTIVFLSALSQAALAVDLDSNPFQGQLNENLLVGNCGEDDCNYQLNSVMNVGLVESARTKLGSVTQMTLLANTPTHWQAGATFLDVKNVVLNMDLARLPNNANPGAFVDGSMTIVQEDGNHMGTFSRSYKANCTYLSAKFITCTSYVGEFADHQLNVKIQAN